MGAAGSFGWAGLCVVAAVALTVVGGATATPTLMPTPIPVPAPTQKAIIPATAARAWFDTNRNGCDTRNDILRRDLVNRDMKNWCKVLAGTRNPDPYTGRKIRFVVGGASEIDIDHVVALSDAWQKGAATWPAGKRLAFTNDPLALIAVDAGANRTAALPRSAPTTTAAPGTTAPSSVSYASCDAVRAAGAAPLLAGQPGYSRELDRDGDGAACE